MRTTYNFSGVKITAPYTTFCTECKCKLTRTAVREYFQNGFHNEEETKIKLRKTVNEEAAQRSVSGVVCTRCEKRPYHKKCLEQLQQTRDLISDPDKFSDLTYDFVDHEGDIGHRGKRSKACKWGLLGALRKFDVRVDDAPFSSIFKNKLYKTYSHAEALKILDEAIEKVKKKL